MDAVSLEGAHHSGTARRSETEQQAFYEDALGRALEAQGRAGVIEHFVTIAGTVIRIAFAGHALERLFMPALAHLEIAPVLPPGATIHVWDSQTTGVAMAKPPCSREAFTDRGDIWGMDSRRFRSAFHWIECSVNLMDVESRTGIYWVQTIDTLPYWTKASPLRTLMHWLMEQTGAQLLHAAAVGNADGCILITGKGGVGKSTTALACLAAGFRYVADDYLVVRSDPVPHAFSLYSTAKLNADQLARFAMFRDTMREIPGDDEKAVFQLYPRFTDRIAHSLPLTAVVTPRISGEARQRFAPASKLMLQRAAEFTTMSQLPHAGNQTQEFMDRLIGSLPGLELVLGGPLNLIPDAISGLLAMPPERIAAISAAADQFPDSCKPLVSIIIPVHNGARFLPEAVSNVLHQNYSSIELIVIDDGSTDEIGLAVSTLPVDVRFFRQPNSGAAAARNRGIKDASGDMIAFLDVDDLWPDGNLASLVDLLLRDPQLDAVHGFGQLMTINPATGGFEYLGNPREGFPYYIGAGLYRRTAFEKVGLFDAELKFGEDTDWFLRAGERGLAITKLEQVTLLVRRHAGNMTRGKSLVELNTLRVFKKTLDRKRAEAASIRPD